MKRILVVGVNGFIGQHVSTKLIADGFDVIGMVRASSDTSSLSDMKIAEVLIREHWTDKSLDQMRIDGIVYCAAAYGRDCDRHADLVDANVAFPLQLLDAAKSSDGEMFVYFDTCFTLDYPYLRPYTLSKKQMVQWGRLTSAGGHLRFVNLQLQHPFGPGDREGKFVPWIIGQCLQDASIDLTDGVQAKDFVFVSDVADAISCLLSDGVNLAPGFHQFECGRGEAFPVRKFVEMIHRLSKSRAKLKFGALPTRVNEVMVSKAEIGSLKKLGWCPSVGIEEGLARTIESIRGAVSK